MKIKSNLLPVVFLVLVLMQGCGLIEGVFKTGLWAGIILVVIIIIVILIIVFRKK